MSFRDGVDRVRKIWETSAPHDGDRTPTALERVNVRGELVSAGAFLGSSILAAAADTISMAVEHASDTKTAVGYAVATTLGAIGACQFVDAHDRAVELAAVPTEVPPIVS